VEKDEFQLSPHKKNTKGTLSIKGTLIVISARASFSPVEGIKGEGSLGWNRCDVLIRLSDLSFISKPNERLVNCQVSRAIIHSTTDMGSGLFIPYNSLFRFSVMFYLSFTRITGLEPRTIHDFNLSPLMIASL